MAICSCSSKSGGIPERTWELKDGKFYENGEWKFMKIGKPLYRFSDSIACANLMAALPIIKEKGYTALELNCYWHQFDNDGDGVIDYSLKPLNELIDSIWNMGMYPCISVETYAVGGGALPAGFWKKYPEEVAIDSDGKEVYDTEYGFGSRVVSIFSSIYRDAARTYIRNLAKGIDHLNHILWFETTVEPQYMGGRKICYSRNALNEYVKWRKDNGIDDKESAMPVDANGNVKFPIPDEFVKNPTWNRFRAQFLAQWINDDAAAWRSVAGENALVAVDYLDAAEEIQYLRDGDPDEFLAHLTSANIIQVNWTWYFPEGKINQKAYDRVHNANTKYNRNWAISEHMTFNGSDFNFPDSVRFAILENTLRQGTRLGWEFVNLGPSTKSDFSLYNDDWSPKPTIASVDDNWDHWMKRVREIEDSLSHN